MYRSIPRVGRQILRVLTLVAALSSIPATAHAQKVFVNQYDQALSANVAKLYDLATGQLEWTLPGDSDMSEALFTSDGRFALLSLHACQLCPPVVRVIDAVRGSFVDVPTSFSPRMAHPRATSVFGTTAAGTLARLDLRGLSEIGGCPPGTTKGMDISGDGRLLFALCTSGNLAVLDAESGALLRTLTMGDGSFAANFDGTALVVLRPTPGGAIELMDSTTGAVLAETVVPCSCIPFIDAMSRDRRTVVVTASDYIFSFLSTSYVLTTPSLTWGATLGGRLRVSSISPDNSVAFSSYSRPGYGSVQGHDLASGAVMAVVPISATIAVSYAPLAPTAGVTVTGRRVDLSWTLPAASPAVTGYRLEVGSRHGGSDIATVALGTQSALTVPAVPPGRYYVRVRAENASGQSVPSGEVVVDVS